MNTLLNGNIHEVQEWLEALEKTALEEPSAIEVPWEELIRDERNGKNKTGKSRRTLLKWMKKKAKEAEEKVDNLPTPPAAEPFVSVDTTEPPEFKPATRVVTIDPAPCAFPARLCDDNLNPVCEIHGNGICFPCSQAEKPRKVCRTVCVIEAHIATDQPPVVYAQGVAAISSPAAVDPMPLGKFDAEGQDT